MADQKIIAEGLEAARRRYEARPPASVHLICRVVPEVKDALEEVARAEGVTVSDLVREAAMNVLRARLTADVT